MERAIVTNTVSSGGYDRYLRKTTSVLRPKFRDFTSASGEEGSLPQKRREQNQTPERTVFLHIAFQ